jgi:hypothetical protein
MVQDVPVGDGRLVERFLRSVRDVQNAGQEGILRLDYRSLSHECGYCEKPPSVIRVTSTSAGTVLVLALCQHHARKEQKYAAEHGFVHVTGTGTFVNRGVLESTDENRSN